AAASQKSDDGPKTAMAVRPAVPARAAAVGAPASDRPASGAPSGNPRSSPRRSVTGPGLAWDNSHTVATVTPPDTTTGTGLSPRRRAAQAAPAATRLPASAVTRLSGSLPAAASAGRASTARPSPARMPASGGRSAPAATGTGWAAEAAEAGAATATAAAEGLSDRLHHRPDGDLLPALEVEGLIGRVEPQGEDVGLGQVLHVDVVAVLAPVALDGERVAPQRHAHELRDDERIPHPGPVG